MSLKKVEEHINHSKMYYLFLFTIFLLIAVPFFEPAIDALRTDPYADTIYMPIRGTVKINEPFGVCHGYDGTGSENLLNLGVQISRNDIYWNHFEPTKGNFNYEPFDYRYANFSADGIESIAILDYGNINILGSEFSRHIPKSKIDHWLDYVDEAVRRYKENVTYFEIWNEPNIDKFWNGTDDEFFYLLNITAYFIKEIDSSIKIISPGISGHNPDYLDRMITYIGADEFNELFYALNFHPYSGINAEIITQKIYQVEDVATKHGYTGELWITEIGMSTQISNLENVNEEFWEKWVLQAEQLIKVYAQTLANSIDKVVWYCYRDNQHLDWTYGEDAFGLQHYSKEYQEWIYKPAGYTFQHLSRKLTNGRYFPEGTIINTPQWINADMIHIYPFYTPENTIILLIWSNTVADKATISLANRVKDSIEEGLSYEIKEFNYLYNDSKVQEIDAMNEFDISLGSTPTIIEINATKLVELSNLQLASPLLLEVEIKYSEKINIFIRVIPWIFLLGVVMVARKIDN